jgi:hypothetical protein
MGSARRPAWEVPLSRGGTKLTKRRLLAYLCIQAPRGRERVWEGPTRAEDGTHARPEDSPDAERPNPNHQPLQPSAPITTTSTRRHQLPRKNSSRNSRFNTFPIALRGNAPTSRSSESRCVFPTRSAMNA